MTEATIAGPVFAIAPMMDWTDRHCRYFHRQLTRHATLFTEMITADAVIHGDRSALLGFSEEEQPLVLQLGGSDPDRLAQAARIASDFGYREFNLNVGCPSDRVQSGTFGACLMREPELVGRCIAAMKHATDLRISVKCRIGVDEQDPGPALDALAQEVWRNGCDRLWVHARKAWLSGLSPKENRDVPPLDHARVFRLKQENPQRFVGLNGGLPDLPAARIALQGENVPLDGAMLGRAAYRNPALLLGVDRQFYGEQRPAPQMPEIIQAMCAYAEREMVRGVRLNRITRHMIGLFQKIPGARRWRQMLGAEAAAEGSGPELIERAFREVEGCGREPATRTVPSHARRNHSGARAFAFSLS